MPGTKPPQRMKPRRRSAKATAAKHPRKQTRSLEEPSSRRETAATKAVRTIVERVSSAFRHAPIGLVIVGVDGYVIHANQALCDMLGYDEDELRRRPWIERTHPEDRRKTDVNVARILAGQSRAFQVEKRYVNKHGHEIWASSSVSWLRDANGTPLCIVGHIQDISEQKRTEAALRENESQFRILADSAAAAIFIFQGMRYCYANQAAALLTGYSRDEIMAMNWWEVMHPESVDLARQRAAARLRGDTVTNRDEVKILTKTGDTRWVDFTAAVITYNGAPAVLGTAFDITERRRVGEALQKSEHAARESERKFRTLAETVAAGTFIFQGTRLLYVNPAAEAITGYSRDELLQMDFWDVVHPDFRDLVKQRGRERQHGGDPPSTYEVKVLTKQGEVRWVQFTAGMIDFDGRLSVLGTAFDITDRKASADALRESESKHQALLDASPDTILRIQRDGVLLDVKGDTNQWRTPGPLVVGKHLSALQPPEQAQVALAVIERALVTRAVQTYEFEAPGVSGPRHYDARIVACGPDDVVSAVRDVTERKRGEEAARRYAVQIQESEQRFRSTFEQAAVGIAHVAPDGMFLRVNQKLCDIVGYTREEMLTRTFQDITHPEDLDIDLEYVRRVIKGDLQTYALEKRYIRADNSAVWINLTVSLVREPWGAARYFISVIEDISERKRAEEALRQARDFNSTVLDTVPALVIVLDTQGRIVRFNRATERTVGYTSAEVHGRPVWEFLEPEYRAQARTFFSRVRPDILPTETEMVFATKDGRQRLISWSSNALMSGDQLAFIIGAGIDITERRQAEEEARHRQFELAHVARVSTMGEMAAALAHELNQPLGAIVSYASGCVHRIQSGRSEPQELLAAMKETSAQAVRAGEIIRRLREFVRKGATQRQQLNVNSLVQEAVSFAELEARPLQIPVRVKLAESEPRVMGDAVQLEQVILNLLRNGLEAMTGNGDIPGELVLRTMVVDSHVEVAIADHGSGLPREMYERVFEPFVSTKPNGLGMGLSISRSIVEAHGGQLWATPNEDRGTTFRFTLPCCGTLIG